MSLISSAANNHGTAMVNSGDVIAHHCPTEPFFVDVVVKGDTLVNVWWDWDGTNITVYHDGLGTIEVRWMAFYV
jgi:hypothetical protein